MKINGIQVEIFEIDTTIITENSFSIPQIIDIPNDDIDCKMKSITIPLVLFYFWISNISRYSLTKISVCCIHCQSKCVKCNDQKMQYDKDWSEMT